MKYAEMIPSKFSLMLLFLILFIQLLPTKSMIAQSPFSKLVWSDEFNKPGLPDSCKWAYNEGTGCPQNCGWGNNELQFYTKSSKNAFVEDGVLKINARKENFKSSSYTSARLVSKGKYAFKYGRVEVKAKLPAGIGTWPAIWLLGNDIDKVGWPACGEIDIMEHRGSELNKIFGTLHYPGRSGGNADGETKTISTASGEFHLYALEWSTDSINIYVDGDLYHTVINTKSLPFNHDFYIILNIAMGGYFGGAVDAAFSNATMEIDYIRVYQ